MKRFIISVMLYVLVVILLLLPVQIYEMYTYPNAANNFDGAVRNAAWISKIHTFKKVKRLILGDSTGQALYPYDERKEDILSLACNQAITMAGQYFLLRNFVEANADNLPDEVILIYSPFSFSNDVDYLAYHYFLKPFPYWKYRHFYTPHLMSRIKSIPWYWTANLPFIQNSRYTPRTAVPSIGAEEVSISQLSQEYLLKIIELTKEYDIRFVLYSSPVREDRRNEVDVFTSDVAKIEDSILLSYLRPYLETISYMPSSLFFDEVHLYDEYVPYDYLHLISGENLDFDWIIVL